MRILVTGASGSGSSTLASTLARRLGCACLDGDNYFWVRPQPPFDAKRAPEDRLRLLAADAERAGRFVLAGSVDGWGAEIEDSFDLIVFLYLDAQIRIERLRARELQRFGSADADFLEWAAQYDAGTREGRSLARQRAWLAARACPVITLEGDLSVEDRLGRVLDSASFRKAP